MKKGVMLFGLFFMLVVGTSFFVSAFNSTQENSAVSAAYQCLSNQIATKDCSRMTAEEILYSSMLFDDCRNQLNDTLSPAGNCWPAGNCDLKTTVQYMLAQDGCQNISAATEWLMDQRLTTKELIWFLEIDSTKGITCELKYNLGAPGVSESYNISIKENKKVSNTAGPCLKIAQDGYWYKIDKSCYDETFEISCNESFISTLLFQEEESQTYHVLRDSHPAKAGDTTKEKIESYCFGIGEDCDYEGSLWAATLLKSLGKNVEIYMPYLIEGVSKLENKAYFPSVFLYFLTKELNYRTAIIDEFNGNYWIVSGNKYYDTGLGVWPFYSETSDQKNLAKAWLFENQDETGCWNSGDITDTAWLLYTLWPNKSPKDKCENNGLDENKTCEIDSDCATYYCEDFSTIRENCIDGTCVLNERCENTTTCETDSDCISEHECKDGTTLYSECIGDQCLFTEGCEFGNVTDDDCVKQGFVCTTTIDCKIADRKWDYLDSCAGGTVCCDSDIPQESCEEDLEGIVCLSNQYCSGGTTVKTYDIFSSQTCCLNGGICEEKTNPNDCEKDSDCTGIKLCESGRCVNPGSPDALCEDVEGICGSACESGYKSSTFYECSDRTDVCCIKEKPKPKWWIWLIFILIVLVVLAIIFRDKLQEAFLKFKTKLGKGGKGNKPRGPSPGRPGMMPPPTYPRVPLRRPMERRILPPNRPMVRHPQQSTRPTQEKPSENKPTLPPKRPSSKSKEELDEVLKKLKDISK